MTRCTMRSGGVSNSRGDGTRSCTNSFAYRPGRFSLERIPRHFGVHYSTVSRAVRAHKDRSTKNR